MKKSLVVFALAANVLVLGSHYGVAQEAQPPKEKGENVAEEKKEQAVAFRTPGGKYTENRT